MLFIITPFAGEIWIYGNMTIILIVSCVKIHSCITIMMIITFDEIANIFFAVITVIFGASHRCNNVTIIFTIWFARVKTLDILFLTWCVRIFRREFVPFQSDENSRSGDGRQPISREGKSNFGRWRTKMRNIPRR